MQLVGEVLGQVSDQLDKAGVCGFDETSVVGNVGRDIVEAGGSAAIAAATGGNVGAAAASAIAGNVAVGIVGQDIANAAVAIAGKDNGKLAAGLTNIGANIIATAAGEGIGAAVGGSIGAINGASIASSINEYNYNFSEAAGKLVQNAITGPSKVGAIGAVVGAIAGSLEGGVGAIPGAAAGYRAGSTLEAIYNAITGLESSSKPSDNVSQSNSNADSAQGKPDSSNANSGSSGGAAPPPDGKEPPEDHNDNNDSSNNATQVNNNSLENASEKEKDFDDLLENASSGRETKGPTKQYEKEGGIEQAEKDFESIVEEGTVYEQKTNKVTTMIGRDRNGNWINVRKNSLDGRATLEQQVGTSRRKIRYDP